MVYLPVMDSFLCCVFCVIILLCVTVFLLCLVLFIVLVLCYPN
jgi:hypothetical protein